MTKINKNWTNYTTESFVPYALLSGAGLIYPLDNSHTDDWEDNTTGFTICTDTDTGNEYVFETIKTTTDVYYRQLFTL
jgi:hypothetical protein